MIQFALLKTTLRLAALCVFVLNLYGCVSIIDASTDQPVKPDPTERTFGEYLDDERLETITAVNLRNVNEQLKDAHIQVRAYRDMILLTGQVPTKELKRLAGKTARDITRVRQVFNELEIRKNSGIIDRASDAWIKTKISSKLALNRDVDGSRVKVTVENKVVYIMGVLTQAQADKATDVVAQTRGVTKVVRAIEYLEDY